MLLNTALTQIGRNSLNAELAIAMASRVLPLFEAEYPHQDYTRKLLSAARACLADPTPANEDELHRLANCVAHAAGIAAQQAKYDASNGSYTGVAHAEAAAQAALHAKRAVQYVKGANLDPTICTAALALNARTRQVEVDFVTADPSRPYPLLNGSLVELRGTVSRTEKDWQNTQLIRLTYPGLDPQVELTATGLFTEFAGTLADLVELSQAICYQAQPVPAPS